MANPPAIPSGVTLAVDIETRDGGLAAGGAPGWVHQDGHISGIAVAWANEAHYVSIRHPESINAPEDTTFRWIEDAMRRAGAVVFHNRPYDEGWFSAFGVSVPETADDTMAMAVMVDENRLGYNLDACCKWRGVRGKNETKLRAAAAARGLDAKSDMWQMPASEVAEYACQDARATLHLYQSLAVEIQSQDLWPAYILERDLIAVTLAMRRRGIRVDEARAATVRADLLSSRDAVVEDTRKRIGAATLAIDDFRSPIALARLFDAEGLEYPLTPKTKKGSFTSDFLKTHTHWLPQAVAKARELDAMADKFIGTYILGATVNGRIHAEVHQLRNDEGGTRSFRLSYSNPPLQQIPARSTIAPLIRGIFLPEEGALWASCDYSQQEPRVAVHLAVLAGVPGAAEAAAYYAEDPNADFHSIVAEMTGIPRKKAKIINLAMMYGLGLAKLSRSLDLSLDEGKSVVAQYHAKLPFIKAISQLAKRMAEERGYIRLLDGARCHFDNYELAYGHSGEWFPPCSLDAAKAKSNGRRIVRADTRKGFNRAVQGGAARQTKKALLDCYREGIVPMLSMHDEVCLSTPTEAGGLRLAEIMRDAIKLRVPMKTDLAWGRNWGEASDESNPKTFQDVVNGR